MSDMDDIFNSFTKKKSPDKKSVEEKPVEQEKVPGVPTELPVDKKVETKQDTIQMDGTKKVEEIKELGEKVIASALVPEKQPDEKLTEAPVNKPKKKKSSFSSKTKTTSKVPPDSSQTTETPPKTDKPPESDVVSPDVPDVPKTPISDTPPSLPPDKELPSWMTDTGETILLFGLPKHGKTWAYCSVIEDMIKRGGKVYVISTDSGFSRTAKAYFGDKIIDVCNEIDVGLAYDIDSILDYYRKVKPTLRKKDLLVIDLVSDTWEWAQTDFVEKLCPGGDITNFIVNASRDIKKFGLFDDNKWNYIKGLHKFVEDIIIRKPCNFIGVANEKEINVEVIKGGSKAKQLLTDLGYTDLGVRAGGMKLLPYKFETVVRIGYDGKYFFQVVGDRGFGRDTNKRYYQRNFYSQLQGWRKLRSEK
jgi:hypothetical protein